MCSWRRFAQRSGIGAVSIYSGDALERRDETAARCRRKPKLFDLSRENENVDDEEVFRRALALAESLRFAKPESNQEEVD